MKKMRFALLGAALSLAAVPAFAQNTCGYNPVIIAPDTVNSLSAGNQASFTSNVNPAYIDWSIQNGTITLESSTVTFTAGRRGTITLQLIVGDGQTCADQTTKVIQIVHPCVVTPASRAVSETYVGGQETLDVQANCEWSVIIPGQAPFLSVAGPSTFNGNGTVTFQFPALPFDNSVQSALGRSQVIYVGDKDMEATQHGWSEVGTDIVRDGNADLLWRNASNGITWMQPMTGLTPGAGATIGGASAPFFPAPDWRIVTTRTWFNTWEIYWRNFATWDNLEQPMAGTGAGTATLINHDDANWRVAGAGIFRGAVDAIVRRNLVTGQIRITNAASDELVWVESDANWRIAAIEDFDGDDYEDILWRHAVTGTCFLILDPLGEKLAEVFHYEPDLNWQIAAAGDVNADGRADIVWRNTADGRVWIQAMDGFRTVSSNVVWTDADPNWQIQGVADFDGNGSKDLLWRNSSSGLVFGVLLDEDLGVIGSGVVHREPNTNWKLVAPNTAAAALNGNH